jgi:hypothetical protein
MAFTGDLEQLHIVDIIQLLNTTRKSGLFSVKGSRGESRIIFSNGYIVGASHLNNKVRIGTVLVQMKAITVEDLEQALKIQKNAGKDRKPLIATLIDMGKLRSEAASRGLKKLIEITIGELINWTSGTFTLDTETIVVSPECSYPISKMEQEISLDAQMVLMDALRIYDEKERDRQDGKAAPPEEELFADVLPLSEDDISSEKALITAEDLGLGDIEHLERKLPQFVPVAEIFAPLQIHRQKIKEILSDFPTEEQEAFASFLEKSTISMDTRHGSQRQESSARGLIIFSEDELLKHSLMTICKDEGVLVFATDGEEELDRIIDQCLTIKILPVLVFDDSETPDGLVSRKKILSLRQQIRDRYPQISIVQISSLEDYSFTLQSFLDGIRAVFPRPSRETGKSTFIADTINFLEAFRSYIKGLFHEQKEPAAADKLLNKLKDRMLSFRDFTGPSSVSLALLGFVSDICERSITFIVRPTELVGDKAIGVDADRNAGPTSAASFKIPLNTPSVFSEMLTTGRHFYGETDDEILKKHLFEKIGAPLRSTIILLPMKSLGKTVTVTYGDFGKKETSPIQTDMLEILAQAAGLIMENALYRKHLDKTSRK